MEREYVFRIRLPQRLPRYATTLVVLVVLGLGTHVFATIKTQFSPGDKLKSSELSANFADISQRLDELTQQRSYRASVDQGGGIGSQSGAWISLSALQTGTAGNYSYDFTAGTFASAPTCVVTPQDNGGTTPVVCWIQIRSSSSLRVQCLFGGAQTNVPLSLICMGT